MKTFIDCPAQDLSCSIVAINVPLKQPTIKNRSGHDLPVVALRASKTLFQISSVRGTHSQFHNNAHSVQPSCRSQVITLTFVKKYAYSSNRSPYICMETKWENLFEDQDIYYFLCSRHLTCLFSLLFVSSTLFQGTYVRQTFLTRFPRNIFPRNISDTSRYSL